MRKITVGIMVLASLEISLATAKPVEIDTPNTHLVIVRPIDSYGNGDENLAKKFWKNFQKKIMLIHFF